MTLEREMQTYRAKLPELLIDEGKFVLIQGDVVAGVFASLDEALEAGYERFGLQLFLVKEIAAVERPMYFSRRGVPCR